MIQKLFIYLTLLLIIPDIYIYRMFIIRLTDNIFLRTLYFLPSLLLLGGTAYLAYMANSRFLSENYQYVGWITITYMVIVFPKILFTICSLFDIPLRYFFKISWHPFSYIGIAGGIVCAGVIIYGSILGKTAFEVKEESIYSNRIPPAFDNYRIVQISDLHIGSWKGNEKALQEAVNIINNQKADLVVFTGDLVNSKADELNGFENILSGIKSKDGVYSILGNHDYGTYYRWDTPEQLAANLEDLKNREAKIGWKMLNNSNVMLYREKDSISLIGVENEGEPPFSQHGDLKKAMEKADAQYKILLSHNPTHWRREVLGTDINLMLSGHTHAMQMAWGEHSPSSYVYPEWKGIYSEEKGEESKILYVNVGLGFIGIPFRIGAWPEITVFTLHPAI